MVQILTCLLIIVASASGIGYAISLIIRKPKETDIAGALVVSAVLAFAIVISILSLTGYFQWSY